MCDTDVYLGFKIRYPHNKATVKDHLLNMSVDGWSAKISEYDEDALEFAYNGGDYSFGFIVTMVLYEREAVVKGVTPFANHADFTADEYNAALDTFSRLFVWKMALDGIEVVWPASD